MENDINVRDSGADAYAPLSTPEEFGGVASSDVEPSDSESQTASVNTKEAPSSITEEPTKSYARFGVGDTVILGRPSYTIGNYVNADQAVTGRAAVTSAQPFISLQPRPAATLNLPESNAPKIVSAIDTSLSAEVMTAQPYGVALSQQSKSANILSSIKDPTVDSAAYAEAAAYGVEHGYSDEMISKLAVLLATENTNLYFVYGWTNQDANMLIDCVDAIHKNADGSYDINDVFPVVNYYSQYLLHADPRLTAGGTDSGGSAGGDASAGDRGEDFMVIGAADPRMAFLAQVSPLLAGTIEQATMWTPQQVRERQTEFMEAFTSATQAGDVNAQATALNEYREFIRSANSRMSDDAALAHSFALVGGTPDASRFARDENGQIVARELMSPLALQTLASADVQLDSLANGLNENIFGTQFAAGPGNQTDAQSPDLIVNSVLMSLSQKQNAVERDLAYIDGRVTEFTKLEADARASGNATAADRYLERLNEFTYRQGQYREAAQMLSSANAAQSFAQSLYSNDRGYSRAQIDASMNRIIRGELPIGDADDLVRRQMVGTNPGLWASLNDTDNLGLIAAAGSIGRALTRIRVPSMSNYRDLFRQNRPDMPPEYKVHHSLPQRYEAQMAAAGINVHETQYMRGTDTDTHITITNMWNAFHRQNNRNPTTAQIQNFARHIDRQFGSKFIWPK